MSNPESADDHDEFTVVKRDAVPAVPTTSEDTLQQKRQKILDWLQPTDYLSPGNEYMKHRHSHIPGTGKWVTESPIFRSWCDGAQQDKLESDTDSGYRYIAPKNTPGTSCLHIRGVAGSGKSVFSASTIQQLQSEGHIVLFFFFRQIVEKNHAAKYLVRDFAAQLLPHCDALVQILSDLSQDSSVSDASESIWAAMSKVLIEGNVSKQVYCVADALDEMDDKDFRDMTEKLIILGLANPHTVKMMITGRPLPKIELATQGKDIIRLKLDPMLLSPDVARYVDARLASLEPQLSSEKCNLVRTTICQRASGLFLHARLITDNLALSLQEERITEDDLPEHLKTLPESLNQVYEEMLKENAVRSSVSIDDQTKILTCVTHSSRPLRLIELGSLVAQMLTVDLKRGKELVRASCGRLLELLQDETVSVIHHSFTEFLHNNDRLIIPGAFPVLEDQKAHQMLVVLCLEYLHSCPHMPPWEPEDEDDDDPYPDAKRIWRNKTTTQLQMKYPLVLYAIANLGFHFTHGGNDPKSRGLAALTEFFRPTLPTFDIWVLTACDYTVTSLTNPMHLLIESRFDDCTFPLFVFEHLIQVNPGWLDLPDDRGMTPLNIASKLGRDDIMQLLLHKGANIESGDDETGRTPLHWAASAGNESAVQLLLDAGVDPLIKTVPVYSYWNPFDRYWDSHSEGESQRRRETAVSVAMRGGNLTVASQFLAAMPATEVTAAFHKTETAEILEATLKTGLVDINSYGSKAVYSLHDFDTTKLFNVAEDRQLDMIRILLSYGADPTQREPDQPTVLHALAGLGYGSPSWGSNDHNKANQLVKMLVDAGGDVNATMKYYHHIGYTPLHLAVRQTGRFGFDYCKNEEILVEALLKNGADPNTATCCGLTPLHLFNPENGHIVRTLVQYGADVNWQSEGGLNVLLQTLCNLKNCLSYDRLSGASITGTLTALLDLGANPTMIDNDGNNVFHYLMSKIEILQEKTHTFLLQRLLDFPDARNLLNGTNVKGNAPIHKFAYEYDSKSSSSDTANSVLTLLISYGMDINARNRDGDTILHIIRHKVSETALMDALIILGADPNVRNRDGKSLLEAAILSTDSMK